MTTLVPPRKGSDPAAALAAIQAAYPRVTDFEREFPSLCFALATGVGKTRLMGAFIAYLRLAHGIRNFFVLAPSLTIYDKLITDFTPNTPKYVFKEDVAKVLRLHQREIARFVHAQMQQHHWEHEPGHRVEVRSGFAEIKDPAYTTSQPTMDFRESPPDKSNMGPYLFDGFVRCLRPVQKFQSDPERVCAVILDREAEKWFRPARGEFQIVYRDGHEHREYQPDFVAETADAIYMLEVKARNELESEVVRAKRDAAVAWCERASAHAASCGGKRWIYALVPHDRIKENMTIAGLVS